MSDVSAYRDADPMKIAALESEVAWRERRWKEHPLRELLLELTDACNLSCLHCGSSCEADGNYLPTELVLALIDEVAAAYEPAGMRISFTGGEPMLHPDFVKIAKHAASKGFQTGMTTNGTRMTKKKAEKLAKMGFGVVTVSLDGMEKSHDAFRNRKGCWKKAVDGIDNLIAAGIMPSITTVANSLNIGELDEMLGFLHDKGIKIWRVLNIDPIGRAMEHPELLLDAVASAAMWSFIEERRINHPDETPALTASCSHYLGPVHELETRDWPFSCRSGITVASVTAKGEYVGCLDVERIESLVMGHLGVDSFVDAWENGYAIYRRSRVNDSELCQECEHARYCNGDSMHTWDFSTDMPKLCIGAVDAAARLAAKDDTDGYGEDAEPEAPASPDSPGEPDKECASDGDVPDCRISRKTSSILEDLKHRFPIGDAQVNQGLSREEHDRTVEDAVKKIKAYQKLNSTLERKNEDILNSGLQAIKTSSGKAVPDGTKPAPGETEPECHQGKRPGTCSSSTSRAVRYMEAHRDDEDADELFSAVSQFMKAGFRAGAIVAALASAGAWLVLRKK